MKKIVFHFFLFFAVFCWADEVHSKANVAVNETAVDEADASYFNNIDFSVRQETTGTLPITTMRDFKSDADYFAYRHYFAIGLGLLIPGLVLTVCPLLATPAVVNALIEMNQGQDMEDYSYFYETECIWWTSFYFSCIGVGVLLDLISIPLFCTANKYYKRVLEKYRVGLDMRDDNLEISMNIAF